MQYTGKYNVLFGRNSKSLHCGSNVENKIFAREGEIDKQMSNGIVKYPKTSVFEFYECPTLCQVS